MIDERFALPASQLLMLIMPAVIVALLMVGYLALRWSGRGASGPEQALLLLALNLLELPVNALIIGLMLGAQPAPAHPAISLPVAVLLTPVMGLSVLAPQCSQVVWRLLGLGLLRWVIAGAVYAAGGSPVVILLGTLVLLGCVVRIGFLLSRASTSGALRRQIDERVARVCGTH